MRMAVMTLPAGLALGVCAALPLTAHAGPLLSGYGGPGQGNQAILGSALLGGSSGGGGTSGGGGGGSGSRGPASSAVHSRSNAPGAPASPRQTGVLAGERGASSYPAVEPTASRSGTTFGLSGADLAYILLAAAALTVTGALTRRIARTRTAKGHG
jgi:hypothetical protein